MKLEEFKTAYSEIFNGYNEKLLACHHTAFNNAEKPIEYLATYIKFLRDYYLITTPENDNTTETAEKVSVLMAAAIEYDKFIEAKNKLKLLNTTDNKAEKDEHWQKFIQLLLVNLGDGN